MPYISTNHAITYTDMSKLNRPFPSSKKSHLRNEAKCETFVVKISFICIIIKTHFHINGFALSLALKVRFFGTRKWPICMSILWALVFLHVYELLLVAARKHLNGSNIDIVERFRGYLILRNPFNPSKKKPPNQFFKIFFLCV